jgi:hypothetical protein
MEAPKEANGLATAPEAMGINRKEGVEISAMVSRRRKKSW